MKRVILLVLLCSISIILNISAQSYKDFCERDTTAFDFPTQQTLCEQFGGNEPDRIIGSGLTSITFASQLPNLTTLFGRPAIVQEDVIINGRLIIDIDLGIFFSNVSLGPGAEFGVVESKMLNMPCPVMEVLQCSYPQIHLTGTMWQALIRARTV